ncbi:MAG: hypothetical protein Q9224_006553, partial [Gallowayella concinna]
VVLVLVVRVDDWEEVVVVAAVEDGLVEDEAWEVVLAVEVVEIPVEGSEVVVLVDEDEDDGVDDEEDDEVDDEVDDEADDEVDEEEDNEVDDEVDDEADDGADDEGVVLELAVDDVKAGTNW